MSRSLINIPKGKRYILSIPLGFVLLLVLLRLVIYFPSVQGWLVLKAKNAIEPRIGTTIEIQAVDIALPNKAVLQGVSMLDQQQDTLLKANRIQTGLFQFSVWNLLFSREEVQNA